MRIAALKLLLFSHKTKTMRREILWILFFAATFYAGSVDFADILEKAVENDLKVSKAYLILEQKKILIDKQKASDGLQISLGLAGPSYTLQTDPLLPLTAGEAPNITHSLSLAPSLSLGFGPPWNSTLSLGLSWSYGFGGDISLPTASLEYLQPLNVLFGLRPDESSDLADRISLEAARISVLLERLKVKKALIGDMRSLIVVQQSLLGIQSKIDNIYDSIEQAKILGTYQEDGFQAEVNASSLESLREEKAYYESELNLKSTRLSERVGINQFEVPEEIPAVEAAAPSLERIQENPAVYMANLDLEFARKKLKEVQYTRLPNLGVSASLDTSSWKFVPGFSFSWKLLDSGVTQFSDAAAEKGIEILELNVMQAKKNFQHAVQNMDMSVMQLERRREKLKRSLRLLQLTQQDFYRQFELGLKTKSQYQKLVRGLEKDKEQYELDEKVLKLDTYVLFLDAQTLVALSLRGTGDFR